MISNQKIVYFVENIVTRIESKDELATKCSLVLFETPTDKIELLAKKNFKNELFLFETTTEKVKNIPIGSYISIEGNDFVSENKNIIAKRNISINNFYRGKLLKKNKEKYSNYNVDENCEIYSYHLNVGHGNCSIIIIVNNNEVKLWMIDCSDYDMISKKSYCTNIDSCFDYIKNKFNIKELHIDKLFLTHPHIDHYSGIERIIDEKIITSKTEFYMNLHYSMPSINYNRLLKRIDNLKPIIIEPVSSVRENSIEIWHPHVTTIRSYTPKYKGITYDIVKKPNNASAVFHFNLGKKSILFPGDIETEKWDSVNCCPSYLKGTDYYIISHHGSLNGHLRNICPIGRDISNLSNCVKRDSVQILMGRNGSYSGIYNSQVINDFNNIVYSELNSFSQECKFLEIDWQTNNFFWDR